MPSGRAINIVMSTTDPSAYPLPWKAVHRYPYAAQALSDIQTTENAFASTTTLDGLDATAEKILGAIYQARNAMAQGDTLLLSYAGHGGFIPDANGDWTPSRSYKAWAVYDRFLLAGEILRALRTFKPQHRVLIVSDCCYCGDLFSVYPAGLRPVGTPLEPGEKPDAIKPLMPRGPLRPDHNLWQILTDGLGSDYVSALRAQVPSSQASVESAAPSDAGTADSTLLRIPKPTYVELEPEYLRCKVTYDQIRDSLRADDFTTFPVPVISLLACSGDESACAIDPGPGSAQPPYSLFTQRLRLGVKIEDQPNYGLLMASVQNQIFDFMTSANPHKPAQWPQRPQLGLRGPVDELKQFVASKPFIP